MAEPAELLVHKKNGAGGFTLLEVVITIGILVSLTVAVAELLKASLDLRGRLSQSGKVTHRMATVMDRVYRDLNHAFIIPKLEQVNRQSTERPTIFLFETRGESSELRFTTRSHRPIIRNANESDFALVVYRLAEDGEKPGIYNLLRGVASVIPQNIEDDPPMQILARNIQKFKVHAWQGDRWISDRWDSRRSEQRDLLPMMVKVEVEAPIWDFDLDDPEKPLDKVPVDYMSTVAFLPFSLNTPEQRDAATTIRWDKL